MTTKNDYDSPWKMILDMHLRDALLLYFPDIAAEIDWRVPVQSLEQEFQQIVNEGEVEKKRVDKLVDVQLLSGESVWLLIHIEVQKQPQADFAERMFVYHYRIYDKYGRHPVSTAILTDDRVKWRPSQYEHSRHGCTMRLDFRVAKLLDYDESALRESSNPFALVTLAQLWESKAGKSDEARYTAKYKLLRLLLEAGYEREAIRNLLRFIDWILRLPEGLNKQLRTELEATVPKEKLMYVTSFEQLAEKRGIEQGIERVVLKHLRAKLGALPPSLEEEIDQLDAEAMMSLAMRVPYVETLDDAWLLLREG